MANLEVLDARRGQNCDFWGCEGPGEGRNGRFDGRGARREFVNLGGREGQRENVNSGGREGQRENVKT